MAEAQQVTTLLMFAGQAEEAMNLYTSLFPDSGIQLIQHYGPDYPGPDGQVVHATFTLNGHLYMAMDSAVEQDFTFNPAISLFVACADEDEIQRLHAALSEGGELMPLNAYPFAKRYAWVTDRFGVNWQLMLA